MGMPLEDAVRRVGGYWEYELEGGEMAAYTLDLDYGLVLAMFAEGSSRRSRVLSVSFLWDLDIPGDEAGGMTYDFLVSCGLPEARILDAMEECGEQRDCFKRTGIYGVSQSIDYSDGTLIVVIGEE
jgi:hypothetical protein